MPSRAIRFIVSLSLLLVVIGASVSQAAPGGPGAPATAPGQYISGHLSIVHGDDLSQDREEGDDSSQAASGHSHPFGSVPDHVLPNLQYWLETDGGENLLLEFPGFPPQANPGQRVSVRGEQHGRAFHVAEMKDEPETAAAKGGGGGGGSPGGGGKPKPNAPSFVGPRDMIVIPITFAGNPTPLTSTTEQIRERGFSDVRSVKTYYREGSGSTTPANPLILRGKNDGTAADRDGLPGDVTSTYSVSVNTSTCDYYGWATAARAAATADGWDLTGYEHIVYLHPRLFTIDENAEEDPLCDYGGLAQIGNTYSWLNGTIALGTWAHELGHNLTLYHSRTLICTDGTVFVATGGTCSYQEYGDPFDVMGTSTNLRHYHARNKAHMSWFPTANVATAITGTEYTLYPIETAVAGLQVLQIPRGREYLYVDVRKTSGFDTYGPTDDAVTGVLIRSGPAIASNGNSYLIDTAMYPTTTETVEDDEGNDVERIVPDFKDAALQVGEGFLDVISGVYIETRRVNPDGSITVYVQTGVTNAAPVVSPGTSSPILLPGVPDQHQGASATDANKNLGQYRWELTSCPGACPVLTNTEGALSGGSASIPGALFTPTLPGSYTLSLTVWDTAGTATTIEIEKRVGV